MQMRLCLLTGLFALSIAASSLAIDPAPALLAGDPAPEIYGVRWVGGESLKKWQSGHIYLIDFWAPWCLPCIEGFQHLQTIQDHYAKDKVHVVSVAIWPGSSSQSPEAVLGRFPDLTYSRAIDIDNVAAATFMNATRSSGLPNAILVDGFGRLAWVGSPSDGIEQVLDSVIAGSFDMEEARRQDQVRHEASFFIDQAASAERQGNFREALDSIEQAVAVDPDKFSSYRGWQYEIALLRLQDQETANAIAAKLFHSAQGENPYNLYILGTRIVKNYDQTPQHLRDLDLALRCAQEAVDRSPEPPSKFLELLARTLAMRGDLKSALEIQQRAVLQASEAEKPGIFENYQKYLQDAVDRFIEPYLKTENFSGTVLLAQAGKIIFNKGYGLANRELEIPNTPETRFQIASISKTFTVGAILLLQEKGALAITDPVSRFLPDFPNGDLITLEHLLTHRSGLPRYVFLPDYLERTRQPQTPRSLIEWIRNEPPTSVPGENYGYSNANYAVLAAVLEEVTQQSYADFVTANILEPLHLVNTGISGFSRELVPHRASGYNPVGSEGIENARYLDYSATVGSGGFYSTGADLLSWYHVLRNGNFLDSHSTKMMFGEDEETKHLSGTYYEAAGRTVFRLNGWNGAGFASRLLHFLDEDLEVIVLCNLNISSITDEIARGVAALALGDDCSRTELGAVKVDPLLAEEIAGTYRFGPDFYVPNSTMEIAAQGSQLIIPGDPQGSLIPVSDREFIHRQHWFRVSFDLDKDGHATGMMYGKFEAHKDPAGQAN